MKLSDAQSLLRRLIVAPQGVVAGLDTLTPAEHEVWESLVRPGARLSAVERVDIYANMYFFRLRDSLRDDFPTAHGLIGADHFHNLITDYLLAYPPSHFSLRYAGKHVAAFVGTHTLSERWPFLVDLATLEWAVLEAFDAADATTMIASDLASVPADAWAALRFSVSPSLQLLSVQWPVHDLWQRAQNDEPLGEINPAATCIRVWRRDLRVYQRPIDAAEHAALRMLRDGASFADVCNAVAAAVGDEDAAQRSSDLLATWIADGLLAGWSI